MELHEENKVMREALDLIARYQADGPFHARRTLAAIGTPAGRLVDGYVIALQTVVQLPDARPQSGHTVVDGMVLFTSQAEASAVLAKLKAPLGWVTMKASQLQPGWIIPTWTGEQIDHAATVSGIGAGEKATSFAKMVLRGPAATIQPDYAASAELNKAKT